MVHYLLISSYNVCVTHYYVLEVQMFSLFLSYKDVNVPNRIGNIQKTKSDTVRFKIFWYS
jgi:hypothetical protein